MKASSSTDDGNSRNPPGRVFALTVLVWLSLTCYFLTPAREAYDHSLDRSNYATYTHFAATGAQWGQEVVPMTGPFGFILYGHTYTGELYGVRLLGEFLLKGLFSCFLLHLFRRASPGAWRWFWIGCIVFIVPTVDDLFHDYAILVATLVLLVNLGERLNRWLVFATVTLGALALFKGTHLVTTAFSVGVAVLTGALERRGRTTATLLLLYAGAVAAFWLIAGQHLANLLPYCRDSLELSAGYNAVMGLEEPPFLLAFGLTLAAGLALVLGLVAVPRLIHRPRAVMALLLLVGFSLVKWKHGFLRADGHVGIFFSAVAVIVPTACLISFSPLLGIVPAATSPSRQRLTLGLVTLVTGAAVIGLSEFWLLRAAHILTDAPARLQDNIRSLTLSGEFRAKLDAQLEGNRREAQVPQIRNEIGAETVDFFGFEQGLILLNGFNYHPRPMGGGSFNVFTPGLQRRNEAFVRNPLRAPRWQILKLQTIDDRLPTGDDPLTLRAILELYSPVLMQRDYLLLERRRQSPGESAPRRLEHQFVRPGVRLTPPDPGAGRLLLFTLDAPLTPAGRLRALLYRPPELRVRLFTTRHPQGRDFVLKPLMLQNPVILSPLTVDNRDLIQLFGDLPGDRVTGMTFTTGPGYDASALAVTFYTSPRPEKPERGDIGEILTYLQHPLYNRTPIELVTQQTGIHELNKEPVTIVHAPGSITWKLEPADQQLIFSYGFMPQSYLDGGRTDGAEFNVEVIWPPQDGRVLLRQMLRPLTVEADRGMHRARVYLPPYEPGALLRIRTDPGPDKDGAYDQTYVTRVQIKQGGLIGEQFNGLGVVPSDGKLPHDAIASDGTRPVFLIHAPNQLSLDLPAAAREFECDIGILPGAYTGEGRTDGVGFSFIVARPDGTRQILARRYLDPLRTPADRGAQHLILPLPGLPAGSRLLVVTDPGPRGDRSWDHSYIAAVRIR